MVPSYGDGTYEVGSDISPGVYRSTEESSLCYWEMLSGFSGELDDTIANGNNNPFIVALTDAVVGFETRGCGDWVPVDSTFPDTPAAGIGDGSYVVKHLEPGRYRADGAAEDLCYWARVTGFDGGLGSIAANGNSPTTVEIAPGDRGFETFGCGTWTKQ